MCSKKRKESLYVKEMFIEGFCGFAHKSLDFFFVLFWGVSRCGVDGGVVVVVVLHH